ncbi:MAG: 30S ribosomal protein S8 [Bacteroidales bacterium]|nr:30S ribosomal protein S8 [Bacteroidales bacterium]
MNTDPIADYLTRLRNAISANHRIVEIPTSKIKVEMTRILFEKGYILQYKMENEGTIESTIKIALKYHQATKTSAIKELKRISKPGLRVYKNANELPRVLNGLGVAIISTSQGLMTDKEALKLSIGGEILCYVS